MKKVNDRKIFKNKYYPIYYTEKLELNLVPVSYYTREQAEFTLEKQFGKKVWKDMKVIKGSNAIKEGIPLGKNSYPMDGKKYQVKKYYIPEEYNYNRSRRRTFIKILKRLNKNNQPSGINKLLSTYYLKSYAAK